jgi:hypothetical protein
MIPEKHVWIFARDAHSAPGGVFTTRQPRNSGSANGA